jgi:hypothetical protein
MGILINHQDPKDTKKRDEHEDTKARRRKNEERGTRNDVRGL